MRVNGVVEAEKGRERDSVCVFREVETGHDNVERGGRGGEPKSFFAVQDLHSAHEWSLL